MTAFGPATCMIILLQLWCDEKCEAETNPDGNERQTDVSVVPTVVADEYNWITEEEGVLKKHGQTMFRQSAKTSETYQQTVD